MKTIYKALCESLITYCIDSWGGAAASHLIILERAQRAILKISQCRPFLYPTYHLYRASSVLTVRQLFVQRLVLRFHKRIDLVTVNNTFNKRNRHKLFQIPKFKTSFSNKFSCFLGGFLFNKVNKELKLHIMNYKNSKIALFDWLHSLNYAETEKLLQFLK